SDILSLGIHGRYFVACRQLHYFLATTLESGEATDNQHAGSLLDKRPEGGIEIETANRRYNDLTPQRTRCCKHVPLKVLGNRSVWNRKISDSGCFGDEVEQETESLSGQFGGKEGHPRDIAAWPTEAGDKAVFKRIL